MKLTVFDKTNSSQIVRTPSVRISPSGIILFNSGALEKLQLKLGDKLAFANDYEKPKDWYVYRSADGLQLKQKSSTTSSLGISCSFVAKKIRESLSVDAKKSFSLDIAPQPTTENGHAMWALLTSKPRS